MEPQGRAAESQQETPLPPSSLPTPTDKRTTLGLSVGGTAGISLGDLQS